jgi:flagellar biosynthesis/type III secretory pathway protein FliH
MADILVRCTSEQRERIKAKAEAARLSMSAYLLKKGLDDGRARDSEDSTTLANVYAQLMELNQNLKAMPESEFQKAAIAVCREVGREVVLYRLSRQVERNS